MIYELTICQDALDDIVKLRKSGDIVAIRRLNKLLDELREHPTTGTGQPEQLKYEYSGRWSRRITTKHRLIYEIREELVSVEVIQAYGHYTDK
jgi:toxin YoeB